MKKFLCLALILLILISAFAWAFSAKKPENALNSYEKALRDGVPEDLKLTIYYMSPTILTRLPVRTLEDLLRYPETKTIRVDASELAAHGDLLRELDASCLQPLAEGTDTEPVTEYLRLVYVLERENGKKLLEVMASDLIHGDSILVNGFEVENSPIFYKLINPFLTETDRSILSRTFDS